MLAQLQAAIAAVNVSAGLTNPMITSGDIIQGGISGVPQRLAIGPGGNVLTSLNGSPAWQPGVSNLITTQGDLIAGGSGGQPQRLPAGAAGQVLTISGNSPSWQNPQGGGGSNPMTSPGDMIKGGAAGAQQRLGIGSAGQVLTVVSGAPAWQTAPAPLVNPMTSPGDLISGGTAGVPQRLGAGSNGQILTLAGGVPVWAAPGAVSGFVPIQPSGNSNGNADTANINAALAAISGNQGGGVCWLAPGTFYVNSTVTVPHKSYILGSGPLTRIMYTGSGVCFYMHDPGGGNGSNTVNNSSGMIRDLIIDGSSNTNGGRTGLDIGDGWGYRLDHVFIENFTTSGGANGSNPCKGIRIGNDSYFTEKMAASSVIVRNNDFNVYMDSTQSDISHGYCDFDFYIYNHVGQSAITIAANCNVYGGSLRVRGNHDQSTSPITGCWLIGLLAGGDLNQEHIDIRMEGNQGNPYSATKLYVDSNPNSGITDSYGKLVLTGPEPAYPGGATNAAKGQFAFTGIITSASMVAIRTTPADWYT